MSSEAPDREPAVETTTCCIVGCGPAGAMLGLMLARAGVDVLVLEKHGDFFRDFRGDTIHPSTLEVIDELGLFEGFDRVPQRRVTELKAVLDGGTVTIADFSRLRVRHPYLSIVPQWDFLDFITDEARTEPSFRLRMNAQVLGAVRRDGRVTGVRYRTAEGVREVRAELTVAADGRHSSIRRSLGLVPRSYGAPIDVLWFRISREEHDTPDTFGRVSRGRFVAMINRTDYWQVGFIIPKGTRAAVQARGIEAFRATLADLMPFLASRVGEIGSWDDVQMLEVQVNRLRRWHGLGVLLVGDAAHAMSPVGGVGINLAIQDAVAAANLLAGPLLRGTVTTDDLARVRRRRWLATAVIQTLQRLIQARIVRPALGADRAFRPPRLVSYAGRVRPLRRVPARLVGLGVRPEHARVGTRRGAGAKEHAGV
jgi:2-polyprenyl-6-methoxyphenol hydroxylase-like FAD-dependent oxidoreductase